MRTELVTHARVEQVMIGVTVRRLITRRRRMLTVKCFPSRDSVCYTTGSSLAEVLHDIRVSHH
jgi:hypothetical protein